MKAALFIAGASLLLSACAPASLTALFGSCPTPLTDEQAPQPRLTPDGRIRLEPSETEP